MKGGGHKFMTYFFHRITLSYRMHSCCTDYARNLYGKRPVRSRNRNCMMYSPTDFSDLHGFYYYTFFMSRRFRRFRRFFIG